MLSSQTTGVGARLGHCLQGIVWMGLMEIITQETLEAKREEVDRLWQAANVAKVAAARAGEEFKNMRYAYYVILQGREGVDEQRISNQVTS